MSDAVQVAHDEGVGCTMCNGDNLSVLPPRIQGQTCSLRAIMMKVSKEVLLLLCIESGIRSGTSSRKAHEEQSQLNIQSSPRNVAPRDIIAPR